MPCGRHRRQRRITTASALVTAGSAATAVIAITAAPAQAAAAHGGTAPSPSPATAAARIISPPVIVVEKGQYLSEIAAQDCGNPADWTGIYAANRDTVSNPDRIYPEERLTLSCKVAPVPVVRAAAVTVSSPSLPHYRHHRHYVPAVSQPVSTYHGSGSMQQCIISRESGGNSQVMNSSGHYGLYQFSYSTWVGSGGSGADFGHASVAEQNRVYYNAVAARGYSDWAPYDGC